jgi:hypothetical protein
MFVPANFLFLFHKPRKLKPNGLANFFSLCADVVPYSAHIPSFADTWGWVMVLYQTQLELF